jgi:glycerol-3-phosphate acyltransferase PlsY
MKNMVEIIYLIIIFIFSYLIGSFPTAFFVTKKFAGKDIRKEGTGNVGAMNVSRATGKFSLFFLTLVGDFSKGAVPVYLTKKLNFTPYSIWAITLCAFGVVLGHCYSAYFKIKEGKFSGGKAIASISGILSVLSFQGLFLPWIIICIIYILVSGYLFLGQFMANLFMPFIAYLFDIKYFPLCLLCSIPIFLKQKLRFVPMLKGEEPKWYWKKR